MITGWQSFFFFLLYKPSAQQRWEGIWEMEYCSILIPHYSHSYTLWCIFIVWGECVNSATIEMNNATCCRHTVRGGIKRGILLRRVCLQCHERRASRRAMFRSHIARVCSQTSLRFEVNDWSEWLKMAFYMEGSLFGWVFRFCFFSPWTHNFWLIWQKKKRNAVESILTRLAMCLEGNCACLCTSSCE